MSRKQTRKYKTTPKKRASPARNVFLTLSLIPLIIGIILIGAWVLDLEILQNLQSQLIVGIFFFLLTFTFSNLLQKRWMLASGWGLLAMADIVTLAWLNVVAQVIAFILGLIGLVLLFIEFYKQYKLSKIKQSA